MGFFSRKILTVSLKAAIEATEVIIADSEIDKLKKYIKARKSKQFAFFNLNTKLTEPPKNKSTPMRIKR